VFADRTKGVGSRVEIRTIDSVIAHIACAYHAGLGLPADIAAWVRQRGQQGYAELALSVAAILNRYPMIVASLAQRHRVVICDEHQDSSGEQHSIVMALQSQGARVRVFGDPMQKIFKERARVSACPPCDWNQLTRQAQAFEQLDVPHRWKSGCPDLGQWILTTRTALKTGGAIDLRNGLPPSVTVVFAENQSQRNLEYQLSTQDRRQIDTFERAQTSLLILTPYNDTARCFRGFFNRRIPLWEGHTRPGLEKLLNALAAGQRIAQSLPPRSLRLWAKWARVQPVGFRQQVPEGSTRRLYGELPGHTCNHPGACAIHRSRANHCGVARMLHRLSELATTDPHFDDIQIDCRREFGEAIRLGDFDTAEDGYAEITHRRIYSRPKPPEKAISIIHKAKGLECDSVIVMPCDAKNFPDKPEARCLLYVALSRAKSRLMLVVSRVAQVRCLPSELCISFWKWASASFGFLNGSINR